MFKSAERCQASKRATGHVLRTRKVYRELISKKISIESSLEMVTQNIHVPGGALPIQAGISPMPLHFYISL